MITTIIITALASVILTLVIGYFIWSGISTRKLKKQVKDNKSELESQEEQINDVNTINDVQNKEIYQELERVSVESGKNLETAEKQIHHEFVQYGEKLEKIVYEMDKRHDDLYRELDKRFDKVYQTIHTKE